MEQLLKMGVIAEKTSAELTEVYESSGSSVSEKGQEDWAPDGTSSQGVKADKTASNSVVKKESSSPDSTGTVTPQAAGQGPAPDGTTTPPDLVYAPPSEKSATPPPTKPSKQPHPSLLLHVNQVKLLEKTFDLRPLEVIDVNRAVEQADQRAKKAEEQVDQREKEKDGKAEPGTAWRGNLHR